MVKCGVRGCNKEAIVYMNYKRNKYGDKKFTFYMCYEHGKKYPNEIEVI